MQESKPDKPQETPPVTDKWRNVYVLLVVFLVVQMVLYYVFMKTFE